jgi:predicted GTPase
MFEDVKEMFEEDYNQYRLAMDEMHLHNVCVDASKYINEYGIDMFLKRLVTYVDNPAQSMLTQRCVEWLDSDYNTQLRNKKAAQWIRLCAEEHDGIR